jgi:hypothetical protein
MLPRGSFRHAFILARANSAPFVRMLFNFLPLSKLHKSEIALCVDVPVKWKIIQVTFPYLIDTHNAGMNTGEEILCIDIIARS